MPYRAAAGVTPSGPARGRRRRYLPSRLWPKGRVRRRWWRSFRRASTVTKVITSLAVVVTLSLAVNWVFQVIRKPSELFFPVSTALNKTPSETWHVYAPLFRRYATEIMTPALLAAIAQVEGSGNPVVRTYWRWSWTAQPFEVYRPASSAVGMYQITDATFAEAKHYCIHNHTVVEDGAWNGGRSCWFNGLYARVVPSHAVELTSAYLDRSVTTILARRRRASVALERKQELAAVIHLCGAGAGDTFVRHAFQLIAGQRCGDHDARVYLAHIKALKDEFERLSVHTSNGVPLGSLAR
jgi:hypothetical protein